MDCLSERSKRIKYPTRVLAPLKDKVSTLVFYAH